MIKVLDSDNIKLHKLITKFPMLGHKTACHIGANSLMWDRKIAQHLVKLLTSLQIFCYLSACVNLKEETLDLKVLIEITQNINVLKLLFKFFV